MTEDKDSEKSLLRIIAERVVVPAFAFGIAWILIVLWPQVLLLYFAIFLVLAIVAAVGYWKGEYRHMAKPMNLIQSLARILMKLLHSPSQKW